MAKRRCKHGRRADGKCRKKPASGGGLGTASAGRCKFVAMAHAKRPREPLPPKWKKGKSLETAVSAAGWRRAVDRAQELRDSTVFFACPGGSIRLVSCNDYSCRLSAAATERKVLAGGR